MTNTYPNRYDNEQDVFLKQITTVDIGPEGDNKNRTFGCKLGSDWLKFHSIGAELTISRSFNFRDFYTIFNDFLCFIALLSKLFSNCMADYLLRGSLDVFSCVGIASPWSTSWEDRHDKRISVKMAHAVHIELMLCCSSVFCGGYEVAIRVRDCPATLTVLGSSGHILLLPV